MKLPDEIIGKNRLRDFKICQLYIDGLIPEEISQLYATRNRILTVRRIQQIVSANKTFIAKHIGWDKSKRVHKLIRVLKNVPETISSRKDVLDVLDKIKEELEGKNPQVLVDNSKHTHVTYRWVKPKRLIEDDSRV